MPIARRTARAGRDRRGALHLRLGPRLPARLPADRSARRPTFGSGVGAGTRLHRDRQRPGRAATSPNNSAPTLTTFRGPLGATGLALGVLQLPSQTERLAWLAQHIPAMPGLGHRLLPHRARHRGRRRLAAGQRHRRRVVLRRHPADERERLEERLLANEIKVLVATTALGMGYDKPDLGFVIHFQMPGSPVGVLPTGRPGRARARHAATPCCCAAGRTPTSSCGSSTPPSPSPTTSTRCSPRSTAPAARCRCRS